MCITKPASHAIFISEIFNFQPEWKRPVFSLCFKTAPEYQKSGNPKNYLNAPILHIILFADTDQHG
jgi:hypothetical protein